MDRSCIINKFNHYNILYYRRRVIDMKIMIIERKYYGSRSFVTDSKIPHHSHLTLFHNDYTHK